MICTCGTDRVEITRDGETSRIEPRATNVFRRGDGAWHLIYRHADAA